MKARTMILEMDAADYDAVARAISVRQGFAGGGLLPPGGGNLAGRIVPSIRSPTMTDRERQFADVGFHSCEGVDYADVVVIPATGREARKTDRGTWEAQVAGDNYWLEFADVLDAVRCGTGAITAAEARARSLPRQE